MRFFRILSNNNSNKTISKRKTRPTRKRRASNKLRKSLTNKKKRKSTNKKRRTRSVTKRRRRRTTKRGGSQQFGNNVSMTSGYTFNGNESMNGNGATATPTPINSVHTNTDIPVSRTIDMANVQYNSSGFTSQQSQL